jgi:Nucleotidyltransferase of unknown function (DUF6036)
MTNEIYALFDKLDEELRPGAAGEYLDIYLLGRAAMVLSYNVFLSTKDIDIVSWQKSRLEQRAIELSGRESRLARSLGLYLDPVPPGLPPVPTGFEQRCTLLPGNWKVLKVWLPDVHDLATTKLKSFRPQDREDLQLLCDRGLLNKTKLRESLDKAFTFRSPKVDDAEDDPDTPDWGKALGSFRRVEAYLEGFLSSI